MKVIGMWQLAVGMWLQNDDHFTGDPGSEQLRRIEHHWFIKRYNREMS
jgi:hypothetical protein